MFRPQRRLLNRVRDFWPNKPPHNNVKHSQSCVFRELVSQFALILGQRSHFISIHHHFIVVHGVLSEVRRRRSQQADVGGVISNRYKRQFKQSQIQLFHIVPG